MLAARLAKPDMVLLTDWEAAYRLNQPDPSLPAKVEWRPTQIGIGVIIDAEIEQLAPEAQAILRQSYRRAPC